MKHCTRTACLPAALLAIALAGPVAAQSSPPAYPVVTVESIQPVTAPPRPNSGKVLIHPGEARGALSDHAGSPGRTRGQAGRALGADRSGLLTDDTTRRPVRR